MEAIRRSLFAQGAYYAGTGVAPFVSRRAFEAVTGPKKEWWLVETVGVLVTAVGAGITPAPARGPGTPEPTAVPLGSPRGAAAGGRVFPARQRGFPPLPARAPG